ncbi:ScpA family protein [Methyloceanibacter sp.]|uniref:segregation and condensation protein A n=1 Tax=Methyloceanibacter sp. TaxID=1965321 RepID=UPI002D60476D|nr:ScpA family protein [Methyloceanibacter sp.]HZP09627.1 ScpA family protein [Methyloceanibacter sp.]
MTDETENTIAEEPDQAGPSDWEATEERVEAAPGETLFVDVEGFEGPLDLLLALARTQKVDLARISVLALAQQYLDFIAEARRLRLEIAADYLVMAAWLAFLKSKLLLPSEPSEEGEPTGAELAALLAFRLKRLDAMREAAAQLMTRKRLGRDVFARGLPEPIRVNKKSVYDANVYDLLKAYSEQRRRTATRTWQVRQRTVWSLKEARQELERLLGISCDWAPLDQLLAEFLVEPELRKTALASSFTATLEMTREGSLEISQSKLFAPLMIRRRNRAA